MTPKSIPMQPEKQHQSIRLFENDFLERLSHVHPIVPLVLWAPVATWLLWRGVSVHGLSLAQVDAHATQHGAGGIACQNQV